jgi:type I restriction-modification system DNA methylase subunit
MNPQQARTYIADLFSHAFNRVKFLEFTRNVLNNNFDEHKAALWNTVYIKDAFKAHVARYERLGTYTAPDGDKLDVLIVHLANAAKLERARTALRNFVADHLKQRNSKDAALVAFISPTETQWRLSYVKMEYSAIETAAGTVGIETQLTPARRSSYLVGAGESCHTAQSRFIALLQETQHAPTLAQLEDAFSVEAVTKEFFKQYAALCSELEQALTHLLAQEHLLRDEFDRQQINALDFVKKLLGQIVFLYFLQKKGWLGVAQDDNWGAGPADFLRRLTQHESANFFNDILEPLFYDTLATDRGHAAWCAQFNCRIPFLNGGLFEPLGDYDWRKVDILLPNRLFTNSERADNGDSGTGILDVFDRYNFTITESAPLEKDVAIDPEMLGKVFENLIEDNRRKGLGSFYTPREIVHYMCQEILINYLETRLNETALTVPRGDLETLVRLGDQLAHYEMVKTQYAGREMPLSIQRHAKLIDAALAAITVCDPAVGSGAFPVGMMSEIVRARSALTPYFNDIHERSAYQFKRHAIQQCLYGVDIDAGAVEIAKLRLWLSLVVDEDEVQHIKPLPNLSYKIVCGNSLLGVEKTLFNEQAFHAMERLKPLYFNESDKQQKDQYKQQIDAIIHTLTTGKAEFDFEIYFSEVFQQKGGFDVVIGNPPYALIKKTVFQQIYAQRFTLLAGKPDLYRAFIERSLNLPHEFGIVCFIVPNTLLAIPSAQRLREFITTRKTIHLLIDLTVPVFGEAAVNNIIFLFGMQKPKDNKVSIGIADGTRISFREKVFQTNWQKNNKCEWSIHISGAVEKVIDRIESNSIPLGQILHDIILGMQVYHNTLHTKEQMDARYLHSDIKHGQNWLAEYGGRHLENFSVNITKKFSFVNYAETAIYQKPDMRFFQGDRLIMREITGERLIAAFANKPFAVNKSCYILRSDDVNEFDLKACLAILNSKCVSFWVKLRGDKAKQALFPRITMNALKKIPVANQWHTYQQKLSVLVDKILAAKSENPKADTSALEREIDQLVYALYELTPDDIAIVEEGK